MATTCSALILRGRLAHVVHVGDTRIYRLRGNELECLTTDHTPAKAGLPNVLTRALGAEEIVRLDYGVEPILVHDRFLLCSDGVHGALSEAQLTALLAQRATPEATARKLVDAALETTQGDNATAVIVDVLGLVAPDRADLEQMIAGRPILPAPSPGAIVDGFELDRVLSDGRYSRVFKAVDRATGVDVVLKFPKEAVAAETIYRQAFVREAWVASRVRSPWIGEVLDPGPERQSCLYTVMPHYAGDTLEQRLYRSPPIGFADGVAIAVKLARAAATLHRAGIVHRDIKPDNVILERNGGLRLVDLGVARLPELEDFPASHAPGTPSYMAPELFAGGTGDERSDQFALGVTIYRLFSGGAYPYGEIEPFSIHASARPCHSISIGPTCRRGSAAHSSARSPSHPRPASATCSSWRRNSSMGWPAAHRPGPHHDPFMTGIRCASGRSSLPCWAWRCSRRAQRAVSPVRDR